MNTDYVSQIVAEAAVRHPAERPTPEDWKNVEADLGFLFPSDYKALVSALGEGSFGCGLNLKNPRASSDYTRLSRECLLMHREPIADLEEKMGFPLFPSDDGAVVIGSIDRQDFYLKPEAGGKKLTQLVWLNIDREEVVVLPHTVSQFIFLLYQGVLSTPRERELREYLWRDGQEPFFQAAAAS